MPHPDSHSPVSARLARAAWFFPVVLWFIVTFYFLGDLGKYSDDYCFTKLDPSTGKTASLLFWPGTHFWRPAHIILTYALQTTLWEHEQVNHFINAAMHGAVVLLLWRLLIQLGRSRCAAALAALAFLTAPVAYEVPFWPAALSTSIATALFLVLAQMYASWSRQRLSARWLPVMAILAFLIPCFNEQPATGIAALPLLHAALAPIGLRPRAVLRALGPALMCAAVCVVYIVLLVTTAYPGARGGAGSYTTLAQTPEKLSWLLGELRGHFLPNQFWYAATKQGLRTLAGGGLGALLATALVVVASIPFIRWLIRRASNSPPAVAAQARASLLWAFAFGVAIFLLAWLPVAAIWSQDAAPRLCYAPMIGIALMLAAVIDAALKSLPPRRPAVGMALVLAVPALLLIPLAIASLGLQTAMYHRGHLDRTDAASLRTLAPTPVPNTVVLPLALDSRPTHTGVELFDNRLVSVWETPWSAVAYMNHVYGRKDVYGAHLWRGDRASPVLSMDENFVRHAETIKPFRPDPAGGVRIPWANILPFVSQADGSLRLVTHIIVPSGATVEVPQSKGQPRLEFRWPPPPP